MKKHLLFILIALLPMVAIADDSGSCGIGVTYVFEESTGTLTISKTNGNGSMSSHPWDDYKDMIQSVIIEDGVSSITSYAFSSCNRLTSVTIPNGVTYIGNNAFENCSGLSSIIIPNSVTAINYSTFENCSGLTSVTIPNSVTSIGNSAFQGCSGLTSITFPNSVTSIGSYAFQNCRSLTSIIIPNSVKSIGENAFYSCSNLDSLIIGTGLTEMKYNSFKSCNKLTYVNINSKTIGNWFNDKESIKEVVFGEEVSNISSNAFKNCKLINTITCLGTTPPVCEATNTFIIATNSSTDPIRDKYDTYKYANLHVPMGCKEAYASAYEWRYFEKIKEDMEINGKPYYTNLIVQQGTTGYTRQAVKADEQFTVYIGSLGDNKVNAVTFNGVDVTDDVVNGLYTTPKIKGESVLSISYNVSSAVKTPKLSNVRVTGYEGVISIKNIGEPSDVYVYSTGGKLIENVTSAYGSINISVPSEQLYVIKVGSQTYKLGM